MLCLSPARGHVIRAVLLAALSSSGASAAPKAAGTLAVLELETPPTMMGLGGQVVQDITAAGRAQGYTLLLPEALHARLGDEAWLRLKKCGQQRACILAALAPLEVDRVVHGSLGRDEKAYLLKLWLVDARSGEVVADVDRSILIASRRFRQDVAEAVPRLMRGEREARGRLHVAANVKGATVTVDGRPVGKTPVEVELKPGKYTVSVEKQAHLPVRRFVDVFAGQVTTEEFRLILEPGAVAEEEPALPPLVAQQHQAELEGLRLHAPAWIAFGAAAATAGAGTYFGITAQRTESDLLDGYDAEAQTWTGTRAQALAGQRDARTANVLFGVAGAAAAAGVLLTLFDVGGDAPVTATPAAGPTGAGLRVEGRF